MSVTDFNNGLVTGLALNGVIFINDFGVSIRITSMVSTDADLLVTFDDDLANTTFSIYEDSETGVVTYTMYDGKQIVLTPMDSIYSYTAGGV